jgi:hypothetical protein
MCQREVVMTLKRNRKNDRLNFEAPVIYTVSNSKESHKAQLKNYSPEGMNIEDTTRLKPDTHIFVRILKPLPHYGAVNEPMVFHTQIKWCHCKDTHNQKLCGMGLQHVSKSSFENVPTYHCALCGEEIQGDQLLFVDDFLYLSSACFDMFTDLEDGVIKNGIEDYMNGNII